jgi:FtsH-binding integral membrane protein
MVGPNRQPYAQGRVATGAVIDEGLRSYMLRVYNYMALGVAFTGAVAMIVAMNQTLLMALMSGGIWLLFIGIIGLGWFAPRIMMSKSVGAAQACFWAYAAMWGLLLGPTFAAYLAIDPMMIVQAFLITSVAFGGLSLYGYTTKRNLGPMGAFLCMATFGLLLVMVVNIFLGSPMLHMLLSGAVVLVFAGLTAYETQQIKNFYMESDGHDVVTRKAIFGAFMLYGSFVTLFIWILNILGMLRGE